MTVEEKDKFSLKNPWGTIREMGFIKYVLVFGLVLGTLPYLGESLLKLLNKPFEEVFLTKDFLVHLMANMFTGITLIGIGGWYIGEFLYKKSLTKKRETKEFVGKDSWDETREKGMFIFAFKMGLFLGPLFYLALLLNSKEGFILTDFLSRTHLLSMLGFIPLTAITLGLPLWYYGEYTYNKRQVSIIQGKDPWEETRKQGVFMFMLKMGSTGGVILLLIFSLLGYNGSSFVEGFFNLQNLFISIVIIVTGILPFWYLSEYTYKKDLLKKSNVELIEEEQIEKQKIPLKKESVKISVEEQKRIIE